ncbi:rhodanese-like domain-containing protein [uncultured Selenomonas sp.]|uniref:rhodanese-like domain-containing protein n=1 Tax=uncultured Selenomonas sp. TaxID=159275 RepID=UPI0028D4D100|nr:rhodanese-like domain-containing protein [uncultured Selenomonas sp.]
MRKIFVALFLGALTLGVCGCGGASQAKQETPQSAAAFRRVSSDEAAQMMQTEKNYIILDVRTAKEYAEGHIPQAINVPNETIGGTAPQQLPDKEQLIFVYCRSGARSMQASEKLAGLGYRNIVEMGGIKDWHGDVVK